MNLALSDEQEFLREAARGALSRVKTVEAAREALEDPAKLPDLWPMATEAGTAVVLVDQQAVPARLLHQWPQVRQLGRILERLTGGLDRLDPRQGAGRGLAQELLLV